MLTIELVETEPIEHQEYTDEEMEEMEWMWTEKQRSEQEQAAREAEEDDRQEMEMQMGMVARDQRETIRRLRKQGVVR
jgi:hypothetical protein